MTSIFGDPVGRAAGFVSIVRSRLAPRTSCSTLAMLQGIFFDAHVAEKYEIVKNIKTYLYFC